MLKSRNTRSILQGKKRYNNENSVETPRTLLEKVIKEKQQRHSSTYVLNDQKSSRYNSETKLSSKNSESSKGTVNNISTILSDSEENITPDFLLISNTKSRVSQQLSEKSCAKRKFKFSRLKDSSKSPKSKQKKPSNEKNVTVFKKTHNSNKRQSKTINNYFPILDQQSFISNDDCDLNFSNVNKNGNRETKSSIENLNRYESVQFDTNNSARSVCQGSRLLTDMNSNRCVSLHQKGTSTSSLNNVQISEPSDTIKNFTSPETSNFKVQSSQLKNCNVPLRKHNPSPTSSISRGSTSNLKGKVDTVQKTLTEQNKARKIDVMDRMLLTGSSTSCESKRVSSRRKNSKKDSRATFKLNNIIDHMLDSPNRNSPPKLHSTALNNSIQMLNLIGSPIIDNDVPNVCKDVQNNIHTYDKCDPHTEFPDLRLDQITDEKNDASQKVPRVSDDITRNILQHFSEMSIPNNTLSVVNVCCDDFWEQTLSTLDAYARHAGRESITTEDVELLLYRQGYAKDRNSLNALIAKYLPFEMCLEILPIATAGNHI